MKTLTAGTNYFIAAWGRSEMFKLGTIEAFAETLTFMAPEMREAKIEQAHARQNGNEPVWSMKTGAAITDSKAFYERLQAEWAAAEELNPNEPVMVEGRVYTLKLIGKHYSDPVHFLPITERASA